MTILLQMSLFSWKSVQTLTIHGDIYGDVFIMKVEAAPSISSRVDAELRQYKDETSLELSGNPLLW
jgi:hypothetical protein